MTALKPISELDLERLALGELEPEREKEIRRRLEEDPSGAARLAALTASNDEILSDYPARQMAAGIEERALRAGAGQRRPRAWIAVPMTAAAAAAVALVVVFTTPPESRTGETSPEVILTKGDAEPALFVYRKTARGEEHLRPDSTAAPGDVLQLRYAGRGATHGVIFSVDGRGAVTLHFPATSNTSTALAKGGAKSLSFSYELDDAPGFERFFFVTGSGPLDIEEILKAGRALGGNESKPLSLPTDLAQRDFLLRKRAR